MVYVLIVDKPWRDAGNKESKPGPPLADLKADCRMIYYTLKRRKKMQRRQRSEFDISALSIVQGRRCR
jgi:hypothetical protein